MWTQIKNLIKGIIEFFWRMIDHGKAKKLDSFEEYIMSQTKIKSY